MKNRIDGANTFRVFHFIILYFIEKLVKVNKITCESHTLFRIKKIELKQAFYLFFTLESGFIHNRIKKRRLTYPNKGYR